MCVFVCACVRVCVCGVCVCVCECACLGVSTRLPLRIHVPFMHNAYLHATLISEISESSVVIYRFPAFHVYVFLEGLT